MLVLCGVDTAFLVVLTLCWIAEYALCVLVSIHCACKRLNAVLPVIYYVVCDLTNSFLDSVNQFLIGKLNRGFFHIVGCNNNY